MYRYRQAYYTIELKKKKNTDLWVYKAICTKKNEAGVRGITLSDIKVYNIATEIVTI